VDDSSETGLALHNGVWDTHLAAESGQEDDELNGVDIVGDEDELGLLGLDEGDDVVETVLDGVWLLGDVLLLLALGDGGGLLVQTLLLLDLGLGTVLVEELEGLGGGVAVEGLRELGNGRGDLQAHVEDLALALQADILGPADHARQVALGLDVLADAIVAGAALDEGVLPQISKTFPNFRGGSVWYLTLACFLLTPALVAGNGAGAVFLPPALGGYGSWRVSAAVLSKSLRRRR
jgi:hypothetical protein